MRPHPKPEKNYLLGTTLLLALSLITGAIGCYLFYLNRETAVPASWGVAGGTRNDFAAWFNTLQGSLILPLLTAVFAYLIRRRGVVPVIGHLFVALTFLSSATILLSELTIYSAFTRPAPLVGYRLLAWINNMAWIFLYSVGLYLLAIFPNSRFLSQNWRKLILSVLSAFAFCLLAGSVIETRMSSAFQIENPFFSRTPGWLYALFFNVGTVAMLLSPVAILASVLLRFYRGQGRERQQMKWLLAGTAVFVLMISGGFLLRFVYQSTVGEIMVNAGLLWPVAGVGVALVRHRLYDIDIIIRRTLLYTAVSATLALVYFGSILLLQAAFSSVVTGRSPVFIVISTLISVALFNPLRVRLQTLLDRRFFRQKYDAQQVLAQFAQSARDEVEMEQLTAVLLQVVQTTIQPEQISLWLKPVADRQGK